MLQSNGDPASCISSIALNANDTLHCNGLLLETRRRQRQMVLLNKSSCRLSVAVSCLGSTTRGMCASQRHEGTGTQGNYHKEDRPRCNVTRQCMLWSMHAADDDLADFATGLMTLNPIARSRNTPPRQHTMTC